MTEPFSLWLVPSENHNKHLQDAINRLSQEYSTPLLEPHVTLYGRIVGEKAEMLEKTRELAGRISQLSIQFTGFYQSNQFFRSLFMGVKHTSELDDAYRTAQFIFESFLPSGYRGREFIPHLSLMYGNIPEEQKKRIIQSLDSFLLDSFFVNRISLYSLGEEPASWTKVQDFLME